MSFSIALGHDSLPVGGLPKARLASLIGSSHLPPFSTLPDAMPTVPPFLFDRVHPMGLHFSIQEVGGSFAFKSPGIKRAVERFLSVVIIEASPIRVVMGTNLSDWHDERGSYATYYGNTQDFARTMKQTWKFTAPLEELHATVTSQEFLESVPLWRRAPAEDGRIPSKGLFLRSRWQPPSMELGYGNLDAEEKQTPDGSASLFTLVKRAMVARGISPASDTPKGN